jgi:molybdate transport system ATP-binding protein
MFDDLSIHARFKLKRSDFWLDVDLQMPGRGITVVQGRSGSGKTTILRCMAGLENADQGFLKINGRIWQDTHIFLPAHKRPIGYVFQEDRLFEHLTAKENMLFGCKNRSHVTADLVPLVDVLGINHLLDRYPSALSGGERQRVAIARALSVRPEVLLMDEPLSSLDTQRKAEILPYLKQIQDFNSAPIVYVTHDPSEAEKLADYVVMLEAGRVVD